MKSSQLKQLLLFSFKIREKKALNPCTNWKTYQRKLSSGMNNSLEEGGCFILYFPFISQEFHFDFWKRKKHRHCTVNGKKSFFPLKKRICLKIDPTIQNIFHCYFRNFSYVLRYCHLSTNSIVDTRLNFKIKLNIRDTLRFLQGRLSYYLKLTFCIIYLLSIPILLTSFLLYWKICVTDGKYFFCN